MIEITISLIVIGLAFLYYYFTLNFSYFKNQGIPGPTPIPLFGTNWGKWDMNWPEKSVENMKKYGSTYGCFNGRSPLLITSDPNLMKKILVENFDHFSERPQIELGGKNLKKSMSFLTGPDWVAVRGILSSALTTTKLKNVVRKMEHPVNKLVSYLRKISKSDSSVEISSELGKTAVEIFACSFFGFELDAVGNPDHKIVKIAKDCRPVESAIFSLAFTYKRFAQLLQILPIPNPYEYFIDLAKEMIQSKREQRSRQNLKDDDYLSLMLDAYDLNKDKKSVLSDDEVIVSNVSQLLSTPFDTVGTPIIAMAHQLAVNQLVQENIRKEVLRLKNEYKNKGGYDYLNELKYLEACILEIMRLYPPAFGYVRICVKDIDYPEVKLRKGVQILIPAYASHRDENYYEDPEKFMPERFLNKELNSYMFNAFGHGPRNCTGKRVGILAIKLIISELVANFKIFPATSTPKEMVFKGGVLELLTAEPVTIGLSSID